MKLHRLWPPSGVLTVCSCLAQSLDEKPAASYFEEYETGQIKVLFHGPEAKLDLEALEGLSARVRQSLATGIQEAFEPVSHALRIEPE